MAKIPEAKNSIVNLIDAHHAAGQGAPRSHLGASLLGKKCDRAIWLSFRWAVIEQFDGRVLRLFRRGHNEEDMILQDLKAIGIKISDSQAHVNFGYHVQGSADAIIESGVPEAPTKRHVAEFKTHNRRSFDDLLKKGSVAEAKPEHYVQMQVYMLGLGIDRGLYVAVCKDDDRMYVERVRLDKAVGEAATERGRRLAMDDRLPPPISTDPSWFECKFCSAHTFCHKTKTSTEWNCRTCRFVVPGDDGDWFCEIYEDEIPLDHQRKGCAKHEFNPDLVPFSEGWERINKDAFT